MKINIRMFTVIVFSVFSLGILVNDPLAAAPKKQDQVSAPSGPSDKDIRRGIEQGYKELVRLYKSRSYESFRNKARELRSKLGDPLLPQSYKDKMERKINVLNASNEKAFEKERTAGEKKEIGKKGTDGPGEKPRGMISKEQRGEETRRIRKDILERHPEYKRNPAGLADAVIERKIKIARERRFLKTEFDKGVGKLYDRAVSYYHAKDFNASKKDFEEVEKLSPDYKKTREYLKKAGRQVELGAKGPVRK